MSEPHWSTWLFMQPPLCHCAWGLSGAQMSHNLSLSLSLSYTRTHTHTYTPSGFCSISRLWVVGEQAAWILIPASLLTSCVTWGKLLELSSLICKMG